MYQNFQINNLELALRTTKQVSLLHGHHIDFSKIEQFSFIGVEHTE